MATPIFFRRGATVGLLAVLSSVSAAQTVIVATYLVTIAALVRRRKEL